LYYQTFRFTEWLGSDDNRNIVLRSILSTIQTTADVGRLRTLTSPYSEVGKAPALAQILMAVSQPELIGKEKEAKDEEER
jgi:hypothetical protein